jgi:hypothetical protein
MRADREVDGWLWVLTHAVHLARSGRIDEGCACLQEGLRQAESEARAGSYAAREAAEHYQESMANFAERFRLRPRERGGAG